MTEPANFQAAIDALAKACVGLADVTSWNSVFKSVPEGDASLGTLKMSDDRRLHVDLQLRDTADAAAHPASREEIYEQAMLYFSEELAKIRNGTAPAGEPTPRDRMVRLATKIRRRNLLTRMDREEKIYLTSVDVDIFRELEEVVDAMEKR